MLFVAFLFRVYFRRSKGGACLLFETLVATVGRLVFLTFDVCVWEERTELCFVWLFL